MSRLGSVDDWLAKAAAARHQSRRLAALCGASDRHLRRFFLETTGLPTQHWLDEVRLWKSLDQLLQAPMRRIKEISFDLGFSSQQRFCLRFARRFGVCPTRLHGNEHVILRIIAPSLPMPCRVDCGPGEDLKRLRAGVLDVLRAKRAAIGVVSARRRGKRQPSKASRKVREA